jgi:hypothetical protein
MTRDNPQNPVRSESIDLLHPADPSTMKREWLPAYNDAYRIKSARVVRQWLSQAGDSAVALALVAFRASPPADGQALIRMIKMSTGVDLTDAVKPK